MWYIGSVTTYEHLSIIYKNHTSTPIKRQRRVCIGAKAMPFPRCPLAPVLPTVVPARSFPQKPHRRPPTNFAPTVSPVRLACRSIPSPPPFFLYAARCDPRPRLPTPPKLTPSPAAGAASGTPSLAMRQEHAWRAPQAPLGVRQDLAHLIAPRCCGLLWGRL
jgi:hypothetical protein